MKVLISCFMVVILVFFTSCARAPMAEFETPFVVYPKYRIDNKIKRICIIGVGTVQSEITPLLTKLIMEQSDVKVIEPGNLQAILGGKIIEYGTGLTPNESQVIAQMFQVDHILIFEEKLSPHGNYRFGGRAYDQINLKIVNTKSGVIIFQSTKNLGVKFKDPRPYGYTHIDEVAEVDIRGLSLVSILAELSYSLGSFKIGIQPENNKNQLIVLGIIENSPADRGGIKIGDKIIEINQIKVNNDKEYGNCLESLKPKQGDVLKFKLERDGKILDVEVKIPVIPFSPSEPKKEEQKRGMEPI